jgi:hypothetical protein
VSLLAISGSALTGCGNVQRASSSNAYASMFGPGGSAYTWNDPALDDYEEPASNNAYPMIDSAHTDGSDFYKVWTNRYDASKIYLTGKTWQYSEICIFPARYVGASLPTTVRDSNNKEINQCFQLQAGKGIYADFKGLPFDVVYVIEKSPSGLVYVNNGNGMQLDQRFISLSTQL